jgi:hypothetical protein
MSNPKPDSENALYLAAEKVRQELPDLVNSSNATKSVFAAIMENLNPQTWAVIPKLVEADNIIDSYFVPFYESLQTVGGVLSWVAGELDWDINEEELSNEEMEEKWMIGEFSTYEDKELFLFDVDAAVVIAAFQTTWEKSVTQ